MSKIDKLNITGIRSFNTQRGETIKFYTPLTLIVGINGSGKTTVIEALKYVATGELPPNAKKQGAFIHDPKLLGEKEVMAQAKLQFQSTTGVRCVVTRSLQLTVTKTARSQKTLENSLMTEKDGERNTISSRTVELDKAMVSYLGVSPAVLENVIFCHQEDSLWPMAEPLAVKKKFDEIFEAQKYMKAIDNLKAIRKKHHEELGKFKILEQHAKEDRDRAGKARKKTETLSDEIEELRTKCQDLEKNMEQAREAAHKTWQQSKSYARILGALEGKRIEADKCQNIIKDLRVHLKESNESDEWLERTLQQFDATMQQYEEERQTKREQWLEWQDEIKELQEKQAEKLGERGKHEHDKAEYERQLDRRRAMVRDAATKHQMRGYDDLADESLVEEFLYKVRKISKDRYSALERSRTNADAEKQEALSNVNRLTERKKALQDNKISARDQIASNDREASVFQQRVNEIRIDEGSKAVVESRIEDLSTTLQHAHETARNSDWESKIRKATGEVRAQEEELSRLNAELIQSTKRASEVAKLSHLKQKLKEETRNLETLMNTHSDRIKKLIGTEWDASTVESVHRKALEGATRELTSAEQERDAVAREIEQTQFKQKSFKDQVSSKKVQATQHSKAVQDAIGDDITEYDTVLKDVQNQVDFARDESKGLGGLVDFLNGMLKVANESHACKMCMRSFKDERDPNLARFKQKLENMIRKSAIDSETEDLVAAEARYKEVLDAGVPLASWRRLTEEEIPGLEQELDKFSQQREQLLKKAEKHDNVVERRQSARKDLDAISRTVSSIDRCHGEIASYNRQIDELSAQQSQQGGVKTLEDIQEEIGQVNESIRSMNKSIAQLSKEQDASKTQIYQSEIQLRDLKNELSTTASQLEKKASLAARVEEFKAKNRKQRDTIDTVDKDVERLEPEIATAQAKHEDVSQRWKSQLADLTRESTELTDTVNNLNLLNDQIKSYIDRGGANQLLSVKRELKALEQEIEKTESSQVQLTKEISKVEAQLQDSENTKRQYSDNLRYRQETRALEQLQDEISELESRNAEVDRDRFEEESKRYTDQYHKYSANREGHLGEMKTKDNQLKELINDYETDFKDAPKRYKEARIKVETTKAAVEDLQRYTQALDKAIMKFHTMKMEQINNIIAELWQKTYQGTDVDAILIRSDVEMTDANGNAKPATSSASTRRQYNYRVTMVKQGIEMDMRGRCSAGQKVLACIIIRLALAEVFSSNCGVIALDEPTTNLDRDNIQALAVSLHDIIQTRRQQSNFQLIVITHDEDFLKHMHCGDFTEYYYRVSRDGAGDSIIERQDILEVEK